MRKVIAKWLHALLRLPLLDFVPRGYLTKASSVLQVIVGAGLLAKMLLEWMATGSVPRVDSLNNVIAVLLIGNGGSGIGVRRAMDK